MKQTGIIILAAGNSSRLGRPKQLLIHHGKTLLQHVYDEAIEAGLSPVIVVFGAYEDEVDATMKDAPLQKVVNADWQSGMASSIRAGLLELAKYADLVENVIISVCDQPMISAAIFTALIEEQQKTGKTIIASSYADTLGTPVLFNQKHFFNLLQLQGNEGAKKLLQIYASDTASILFKDGQIDIDVETDYLDLIQQTAINTGT